MDDLIMPAPRNPMAGDTVRVSLTVRNSGERAVPLYSVALFRGNPSPGQIETAELLDTVTPESGLGPGGTEDILMEFVAPEIPGVYDVFAWIDAAQLVDELDETNNLVDDQIEVLARDFEMNSVVPIPSPAPGRTRFFVRTTHEAEVEVKIYTVSGRLVHTLGPRSVAAERAEAIDWRCEDRDGDRVGNGVYFYRVDARSQRTSQTAHFEGKILVVR
jgi:hypothetical protein